MRKSLIHYIAPSAISITPNANGSVNDIAVYVARGAKFKLFSPNAGIDMEDDVTFKEWTLEGRNRRLNDPEGTKPFTIYARLRRYGEKKGYLVFASKRLLGYNALGQKVWVDKYSSVTEDGQSVLYTDNEFEVRITDNNYWYVRLGDVSLPINGKRTVTLDTGILGTEKFNIEFVLHPDTLPLRVDINCTIDGKDAGGAPYVPWGKAALLVANLVNGWNDNTTEEVHHWCITRNTGNDTVDEPWNYPYQDDEQQDGEQQDDEQQDGEQQDGEQQDGEQQDEEQKKKKWPTPDTPHLMTDGSIILSHFRGGNDDFAGSQASVYTISAWGLPKKLNVPEITELYPTADDAAQAQQQEQEGEDPDIVIPTYVQLASGAITIYANSAKLKVVLNSTIDGINAGQTPYVLWDKSVNIGATLVEGTDNDASGLVDHWTISRNTNDSDADEQWNYPPESTEENQAEEYTPVEDASGESTSSEDVYEEDVTPTAREMEDGFINLSHHRDNDDFNRSVVAMFTITAWGKEEIPEQTEEDGSEEDPNSSGEVDSNSSSISSDEPAEPVYYPLADTTISIFAETIEKYELALSSYVIGFNPQTKDYNPSDGITVRIRITDQSGNKSYASQDFLSNTRFAASYAPAGTEWEETTPIGLSPTELSEGDSTDSDLSGDSSSDDTNSNWTQLVFEAGQDGVAVATIPSTAFSQQMPLNVLLKNGANVMLDMRTIAFVRDGEDSKEREWIYRLNSNAGYNATTGTAGGTAVSGQTDGVDNCLLVDDFVPTGWSDDPTGVSQPGDVEWESWRDYDDENHRWGTFHTPVIHNRYAEDGGTQDMRYQWNQSATTAPSFNSHEQNPGSGWQPTVPDRPGDGYYLWAISAVKKANGTYGRWGNAIRLTGDKGTAGEDGSDHEYIYIRQNTYPFSGTLPANITTPDASSTGQAVADDDFVPVGWSDTALPADNDNRYVYMSVREKPAGEDQTWGPFGNPVLWSNWGVRGTDGDGVEYVFIRTKNNVAPVMVSTQADYLKDEFRPTITAASQTAAQTEQAQTTDDPKGPDSTYPYEWVATRSKGPAASDGTRQWTEYTGKNNDYSMSLWSRWAEDGGTQDMRYQWNQSATTAPPFNSREQNPGNGWQSTVPDRPGDGYYLWAISAVKKADGTYGTWGNAIRLTGDKGTAGEDGSDHEYIYIRQNTYPFSGTLPANITTPDASSTGQTVADDDFVPSGWSDTALPADNNNRYVYMSVREKPAGAGQPWGPFGNPVLWSNWGVRGTDGDGVEYVFIRTKNNVVPIMDSVQAGYAADEFRPTITSASQTASITEQAQTTDDPKGPDSTYPYEWVATRSKGAAASDGTRQWAKYTGKNNDYTMSLWSRYAEDAVTYDIVPSVSVINAKADGTIETGNIEVWAFSIVGTKRTEISFIAHSDGSPVYEVKFSVDGKAWRSCERMFVRQDGTLRMLYGIPAASVRTATVGIALRLVDGEGAVLKETPQITVVKDGDTGPKGDDAQEVNPNILLRTIFDRGIDFVLEAWTRNSELIAVDGATDTIVNGRKSLRMDASALSKFLDFQQNVFGKVRPSTWYTLSFHYFATQSFQTFLWDTSNTTPWIDLSEGYYIDGADTPTAVTRIDGYHEWPAEWSGNRHSMTFKTASTFSTTTLYVLFRCLQGGQVAICMPKLEEGRTATAYMAHEDDLKGNNAPYNEHAYALSQSRTSHADGDLYQVNGERWFPSAPDPMPTHPYVWERIMHYTSAGVNDQTSYICLTGAVGAMGKLCYMAGEYRTDVEYTSNDSQTVAVEVSGTNDTTDIYYLNAESNVVNGTHISPTDSGQTKWVHGMSQYNLVRARYLFADFAQFGAAVVSGDWFISVHGTINGTAYEGKYTNPATYTNGNETKPTYFWFDPAYPNEDHAGKYKTPGSSSSGQWGADHHNFIPNYAVNLLTGKTYQNDAYVRGEVHATSGVFSGLIKNSPTYINSSNISNFNVETDLGSVFDFEKAGTYLLFSDLSEDAYMFLPGIRGYFTNYTNDYKERARSLIGNKFLVYNKSNQSIIFSGHTVLDGMNVSFDITRNELCFMECKIRGYEHDDSYPTREGYEDIYWDCKVLKID